MNQYSYGQNNSDTTKNEFAVWSKNFWKTADSLQQIMNDSVKAHPYKGEYRFWISSLDKAMQSRTTYDITDSVIKVKTGPYDFIYFAPNYYADKVKFETKLSPKKQKQLALLLSKVKADTLRTIYTNMCIIDGCILHFCFEWPDKKMSSTVSNYYLEKMVPVIEFVNSIVPKEYRIWYDKKTLLEEMKGCKNILD